MKPRRLVLPPSLLLLAVGTCLLASPLSGAVGDDDDSKATIAPIEVKPDAYTQRDYLRQQAAWERRLWVDGFHAHGRAGQPWDDEAEAFVDQVQTLFSKEDKDEAEVEARKVRRHELFEHGRKLVDGGCDDPVVLYFTGRLAFQEAWNWRAAFADYELSLKRLSDSAAYPRATAVRVGLTLRDTYQKAGYNDRIKGLDKQIVGWIHQSITDGSYRREDDYLFVQWLLVSEGGFFKDHDEAIAEWLPDSALPDWAKQTVLGYIEINRAWKSRGSGWSNSVTDDGWKGFGEHLALARAALVESWQLRPDRPEAAKAMMAVVGGGGAEEGESIRMWFDRTVAAQFDYPAAYSEMLWYLRPRWSGSHAAMLAFGRAALATKRFDTGVPTTLIGAVNDIADELADWRDIYHEPAVAEDILTLGRGLVDEPTRRAERPAQLSLQAVNAWMCGRPEVAQRALAVLAGTGGTLHSWAVDKLARHGMDQASFLSDVLLLTGPAKDGYLKAESLYRDHEVDAALTAYEALLKIVGEADPASYLPARRRRVLLVERALERGGWVRLVTELPLADWRQVSGKWSVADGALQNHGAGAEALIVSPVRVGPNFEVRGKFEVDDKTNGADALGVIFGYDERSNVGGDGWHTCEVWQNGPGPAGSGSLLDRFHTSSKAPKVAAKLERVNTFLMQCWDGKVWFYVNGEPVLKGYEPAYDGVVRRGEGGLQMGFGAHSFGMRNTTTIRDIEVRRLTTDPVAPVSAGMDAAGISPGEFVAR